MVPNALAQRLRILPDGWHTRAAGRRAATQDDPLLFAFTYLRNHLRLDGQVTYSEVHLNWYDQAERWMTREPSRDIYVAPRSLGKSTHFFLLLPMWAAAHGHVRFAAAFSDSALQAEQHLATFKHELDTNELLRADYPELCYPARRPRGATVSDNRGMLHVKSGFAFAARGIDSGNLGMKVGERRPDLLVMDDIEPGSSNYSGYQAQQRLETVTDVILPLNDRARVVVVGTTTMRGSLIHQAVMHDMEPAAWIKDERFRVHHAFPFNDEGESVWPERWSTEYLRSMQGTRAFAKNFLNHPVGLDGEYWQPRDFTRGVLPAAPRWVISIDPAVTTNRSSDETAIAVVSFSPAERKACVMEVMGLRVKGEPLRQRVLGLIARYPRVSEILFERNQGGDMMAESVLHSMPVPVRTVHATEKKELRAERLLNYYTRGQVLHAQEFTMLESQMLEFPNGLHDDLIDAVGQAVDHFAGTPARAKSLQRAVR